MSLLPLSLYSWVHRERFGASTPTLCCPLLSWWRCLCLCLIWLPVNRVLQVLHLLRRAESHLARSPTGPAFWFAGLETADNLIGIELIASHHKIRSCHRLGIRVNSGNSSRSTRDVYAFTWQMIECGATVGGASAARYTRSGRITNVTV